MTSDQIDVVVDKQSVRSVKAILDQSHLLDRTRKIVAQADDRCCIPVIMPVIGDHGTNDQDQLVRDALRRLLDLPGITSEVIHPSRVAATRRPRPHHNKTHGINLRHLVQTWTEHIPRSLFEEANVSPDDLLASLPRVQAHYHPMLLLAKSSFTGDSWTMFFRHAPSSIMEDLYKRIANEFHVTHIARLGSISFSEKGTQSSSATLNTLRRPTQLQPLFGNFGEYAPLPPSSINLPSTLWVSVKQNGIYQCWAPLYTMFSQGNVTEKHRLLRQLESLHGGITPAQSTAVDLYAGIGYFSFCYAKTGFGKVLCWELNPWSVEGLRRGAAMNKWGVHSVCQNFLSFEEKKDVCVGSDEDIVAVFEEDNKHAAKRIEGLRTSISPIRHVNCGILPTSKPGWKDAIEILDPVLGGWIHLHENIVDRDKSTRLEEILQSLRSLAAPRRIGDYELHKVKSYGPGITHYVLDVQVYPPS